MGLSFGSIKIDGAGGRPLPNTYVRQSEASSWLTLLFPGLAYTNDMPLLYYTRAVALSLGADALCIDVNYGRTPEFRGLSDADQLVVVGEDAAAVLEAAREQHAYQRYLLVGKSLGTYAVGSLVSGDHAMQAAQVIWLTPPLNETTWRAMVKRGGQPGLFIAGTADPYYRPEAWESVVASVSGRGLLVQDANHSLEVPANVFASLHALESAIREIRSYITEGPSSSPR